MSSVNVMGTLVDGGEITVVDLGRFDTATLTQEQGSDVLKVCDEIKTALTNNGLVFLVNHGISEEEMKYVFSLLDQFLALPDDVKDIYKSSGTKDIHGYLPQNTEKFFNKTKKEVRESFNIINFDRKLPNKEIPGFSVCVKELFGKLTEVANIFLQLISIGLGLGPEYLVKHHHILDRNANTTILRLICYPPVEEEPSEGIIRIEEHTDYGTCTLLMQDSEGGLEVKGNDGEWRRVGYIPGAILINTSDLLEVWTSGEYKAALHRVIVPKENHIRNRTRHSMAFFVHPDADTVVKPFHAKPGEELKEYNVKEYILNRIRESETNKEETNNTKKS